MTLRLLLVFADPHQARPVSPYGLEILRGHLKAHGAPVDVRITNPFIEAFEPETRLRAVLEDFRPDLIGISMRNIDNAVMVLSAQTPPDGAPFDVVSYVPGVRMVVRVIREWDGDVPVVMGGAAFTSCPEECLRDFGLDFGLIGPAEDSFRRLVEGLLAGGPPYYQRVAESLPGLPGAVWRETAALAPATRPSRLRREPGDVFHLLPPQPMLADEPAYTAEIAPEYQLFAKLHEIPIAIRTKTGCPLRCAYCLDPINMRRTYYRPLEHVLADFAHYIEEYDLHKFHIADSEVNLPKEDHLIEVCDGLVRTGLAEKERWHGYFNIRPCSNALIDALVRSNCYFPSFSVDSFDERILKVHQKNFTLGHATDALDRLLERRGETMAIGAGVLFGMPGETLESIDTTVTWMKRYADRGARIGYSCGLRVYPNTPLARYDGYDPRHIYVRPGMERVLEHATDGRVTFAGETALLETVVYCSPLPPRELAGYLAEQFAGYTNINIVKEGVVTEAGLPNYARHFNVGVYALANDALPEARAHLDLAYRDAPDYKPLALARTLLEQREQPQAPHGVAMELASQGVAPQS